MAVEDFLGGEVAIAVAATAALSSSRVRKVLRRGVVYGLAGVLMAGDTLTSTARAVGHDAGQPGAPDPHDAEGATTGATAGTAGSSSTLAGLLRRGAVSGLATMLTVGETLAATARSAGRDIQQATATVVRDAAAQAKAGGSGGATQPTQPAPQDAAGTENERGVPDPEVDPDA